MKGHLKVLTSIRLSFAELGSIERAWGSIADVILLEKELWTEGEESEMQLGEPAASLACVRDVRIACPPGNCPGEAGLAACPLDLPRSRPTCSAGGQGSARHHGHNFHSDDSLIAGKAVIPLRRKPRWHERVVV
jgi:hypothetical protein